MMTDKQKVTQLLPKSQFLLLSAIYLIRWCLSSKGLIVTIKKVFPDLENIFYLKYLYRTYKKSSMVRS